MPKVSFQVTPKQYQTIMQRTKENGYDDPESYIKHAALKVEPFTLSDAGMSNDAATQTITFETTDAQYATLEANMEAMECESLERYLTYIALHSVSSVVIEVRSDGTLDDMLERIQKMKQERKEH